MNEADCTAFWMEQLAHTRDRLKQLPATSRLRCAVPEDFFAMLEKHIEHGGDRRYWPPFFNFLANASDASLSALEGDLDLVLRNGTSQSAHDLSKFICAKRCEGGKWRGGLFDLWVRAALLRQCRSVQFDAPLPNGRNSDVRFLLGHRRIRLENTVLTEDDKSRQVFDRFLDDKTEKQIAPDAPLWRPGPCDPRPNPSYNTVRLYLKLYDKLAVNLDPSRSQCADDEPNVLLVSFAGFGVSSTMPGYGWALDRLFGATWDSGTDDGGYDISLGGWLLCHLEGLRARGEISLDEHLKRIENFGAVVSARRRLSGIVLFDDFRLTEARINYNAQKECLLTHAQMAELESLLSNAPAYC